MSITYPVDILSDLPGWTTEFNLLWRQEQSRAASGRTYVKDFGSPLWQMTAVSRSLSINELDYWRARLDALENGLQTLKGWSMSRCRPIKHPGTGALPTGSLSVIETDRKVVTVSDLTDITMSVGDMMQIGSSDLHRIVDISGGQFEVRPHIWPGVTTGASVSISKPACTMAIVPGSISSGGDPQVGRGSVSFQAVEAR